MEWINLFFITFHLAFRFTFFFKNSRYENGRFHFTCLCLWLNRQQANLKMLVFPRLHFCEQGLACFIQIKINVNDF